MSSMHDNDSDDADDEYSQFSDMLDLAALSELDMLEAEYLNLSFTEESNQDQGPREEINQPSETGIQSGCRPSPPVATKRPRGRPKGSQNKKTLEAYKSTNDTRDIPLSLGQEHVEGESSIAKRPVGRPPGTGPKQRAALTGISTLEQAVKKRPVGRPRKIHHFGNATLSASSSINGLHVPGLSKTGPTHRNTSVNARHGTLLVSMSPPPQDSQLINRSDNLIDIQDPSSHCSVVPSEYQIIPENDPSRIVDLDDEDNSSESDHECKDESRLLQDGIGDEDDGDDDEGEEDHAHLHSNRRHPLPAWLQDAFDACVDQSSRKNCGADGLPPLYRDHQTFWFPRPSPYFQLRKPKITPQDLYRCDIFLWDPECLIKEGIRCPNPHCGARLWRLSHIARPRRVVDLDRTFWILGYRYRCPQCVRPQSITFRSWDPRILAVLPHALAAEFPAQLSHQSGISKPALNLMRSCFQHGMGAKQFSNALLIQNLQNYDNLHLSYLHEIAERGTGPFLDKKYKSFPPFHDQSSDGLHGFVPSAQWLRDMYDKFVAEHRLDLNQHTAMLTGEVCAIDHSFKLTKHIAKVNGVPVFIALLTVTNEKGEIRICDFVETKSHSQYEFALTQMSQSLNQYGHIQPTVFYTDNMADKEFLEKCFPSLCCGVIPVEKYAELNPFTLPGHINVSVKKSERAIEDAMCTILDLLSDNDTTSSIVIGLDAEWNIETSESGYITGRGQTAIIQIALDSNIFILQVGLMLAGKHLPLLLRQVLANPYIIKVGRGITADLKYLEQACQSSVPFQGALDLAQFAKDRLVVSTARCSLADLCATVLHQRLNKNITQRLSTAWEDEDLTPQQIQYAALDAFASLQIYNSLQKIAVPSPLPEKPLAGTPIILWSGDRSRVIASGIISSHIEDASYAGISLTPSRCVIEVQKILIPGAIVTYGGRSTTRKTLEEYGALPFHLVCLRKHLRISETPNQPSSNCSLRLEANSSTDLPISNTEISADELVQPIANLAEESSPELLLIHPPSPVFEGSSINVGDLIQGVVRSNTPLTLGACNNHAEDPVSREMGEQVLQELHTSKSKWIKDIRSRVLKDPFHVFNMFYISAGHGLLQEFSIALRDAIFIPDSSDRSRIIAWGLAQNPSLSWNELLFTRPHWLWRRCKRIIPPPEELYSLVSQVFQSYGPLKDAKTGLPLFNAIAWATAKNILELVRKGFISDPPGIALFYELGVDVKTGLPLYRCIRGTNMTEGGVHTHLRSRMPSSGASIEHTQNCLNDFVIRHNLLVGTYNSTGQRYVGHYSIWLTNELQEMISLVQDMLVEPCLLSGWINGNLYKKTNEVTGVLPIPEKLQTKSAMAAYVPALHSKQPLHFLAEMQGTRKPVLPIHSNDERTLFRTLMTENVGFNHPITGPNWDIAVQIWNNEADVNDKISYKA
ncbi:hypothetical protein C0992_004529 [Termitomyces sp. T32_za158]|nr:hypothetical protein C0992_004529 [Termitomyces sp. T32_za158]